MKPEVCQIFSIKYQKYLKQNVFQEIWNKCLNFCPKYLFHHTSKTFKLKCVSGDYSEQVTLYLNLSILATAYLSTHLSLCLELATHLVG